VLGRPVPEYGQKRLRCATVGVNGKQGKTMVRRFYNISATEMNALLTKWGFQRMKLPGTTELVYGKGFKVSNGRNLTCRIYTAINPSGESRARGSDAIRVCIMGKKSRKVLRVENWKENLANAVRDVMND